jgi:hypothetical protein
MRQVKARLIKLNGLYGDDSDDSDNHNAPEHSIPTKP